MATKNKFSKNDLYADVEKLKEDLLGTTYDLGSLIGNSYQQSMDNVKDKSALIRDNVANYIVHKPFKSVGIAIASGFLLGYLLRRK
ncbi:DUF883 family protein [Aquicella lusitana]|uniref:ElaB/YqjD/DUF883 family membrane-anchored ribosome-binding protein n=1 Tax=Aquicella lusitana TaxID=254246 RepID=A0A370GFF0_9COXI|nr:hypothetical protein [Aquicella lusitana]RDI42545.1 ElaB/YqjD/DUF883 family membrane-anchored ribosome-binding protein [Aquicella lusitana]VVC74324.1 hypothetical protein AQULUS_20890 [Aquicella lusitana]